MQLCDTRVVPEAELTALWHDVFGDPPALAEGFLRRLGALGYGLAAVEGERLLGAAYGVDAFSLGTERAMILYAVAVRPEARGCGLGTLLCRRVFEEGPARGASYLCTEPAEPSLFGWYERILGVRPVLFRERLALDSAPGLPVRAVGEDEYLSLRRQLTEGSAFTGYTVELLAYEKTGCRLFGGDLYAVGGGIAAARIEDGAALVRECLGPEPERQAAAVGAALGCEKTLLLRSGAVGTPFLAGDRPLPPGTRWDLTMD